MNEQSLIDAYIDQHIDQQKGYSMKACGYKSPFLVGVIYNCWTEDFIDIYVQVNSINKKWHKVHTTEFQDQFRIVNGIKPEIPSFFLDPQLKTDIYHEKRFNYIVEDMEEYFPQQDLDATPEEIEAAATDLVYHGKEDASMDYWSNLEAALERVKDRRVDL